MFVFYGTFVLVGRPSTGDIHVCYRFLGDKNDGNGLGEIVPRSCSQLQREQKCTIRRSGFDFVGMCERQPIVCVYRPDLTTSKNRLRRGHSSCIRTESPMSRRLCQLIALWFVVQIVVPFTAPLQTLDLLDFLGRTTSHTARTAPESSTTPTIRETSAVGGLASLVTSVAQAVTPISDADAIGRTPRRSSERQRPILPVQSSILRL